MSFNSVSAINQNVGLSKLKNDCTSSAYQILSTDPRLNASNGFTDCLTRIWDSFVRCVKSFLNLFYSPPTSNNTGKLIPRPRNGSPWVLPPLFWVNNNSSEIKAHLAKQMQYGMEQMAKEPVKSFQYQNAPSNWDMYEGKVGNYQVGVSHAQGRRPSMEDEHLATSFNLTIGGKNYPIQLFGIFDGHGGGEASKFVRDHLKVELEKSLKEFNPNGLSEKGIWQALKVTMVYLDSEFHAQNPTVAQRAGTTATVAMVLDGKIWTANVGDSRTVLDNNGSPIQLSEDAKPNATRYRRTIEKLGGKVVFNGKEAPRINGDLAVARAIGDHRLHGVSPRPKITVKPLSEIQQGSHLILACDGIYEVACTQDVVRSVHENRNSSVGTLARNITYSAYNSGSQDNLSAMVIKIG
jgi:serine/threonine protein phosphatase PrpC